MADFTPKDIVGTFQRGYNQYYKYIHVKTGSTVKVDIVLAADILFSYCIS
jgi:F-type H+-transporting ATPase subunit f